MKVLEVMADVVISGNKSHSVIKQLKGKNKESWNLVNSSVQMHKKDIFALILLLLCCQPLFYV